MTKMTKRAWEAFMVSKVILSLLDEMKGLQLGMDDIEKGLDSQIERLNKLTEDQFKGFDVIDKGTGKIVTDEQEFLLDQDGDLVLYCATLSRAPARTEEDIYAYTYPAGERYEVKWK